VLTQVPHQRTGVQQILPLAFDVVLFVDRLTNPDRINGERLQFGIRCQAAARRR
jgi:hypothetical protein